MRAVVACVLLLAVSGCGHHLDGAQARACSSLVEALPSRVGDQRSAGTGDDTASWGDPKVQLTCGVAKPHGFTASSACQNTDGLDWYVPEDQMGSSPVDVTMTTVGRSPRIEVTVPKDYWPPVAVMSDLAKPVLEHTRKTTPCV